MPARPNSRISARPMTKGGVMMGRMERLRSSHFALSRVRSAISASASPSTVHSTPTSTATATVFQATPQLPAPRRQPRLHMLALNSFSANSPGTTLPSLSFTAEARMENSG